MEDSISVAKFYGSSLPRPYLYNNPKFKQERVDPPPPVLEPFLHWARDAKWKMGGLNLGRYRSQGKIEGRISKLRDMEDDDDDSPQMDEVVGDQQKVEEKKKLKDEGKGLEMKAFGKEKDRKRKKGKQRKLKRTVRGNTNAVGSDESEGDADGNAAEIKKHVGEEEEEIQEEEEEEEMEEKPLVAANRQSKRLRRLADLKRA